MPLESNRLEGEKTLSQIEAELDTRQLGEIKKTSSRSRYPRLKKVAAPRGKSYPQQPCMAVLAWAPKGGWPYHVSARKLVSPFWSICKAALGGM